MNKPDGRRDLSLIRASGSTARVLNLPLVCERFGDTEEYKARPLFQTKQLNRALIIKHVLRPHERELFDRPISAAAKLILPYSANDLGLGGVTILVGERRWQRMLRETVGADQDCGVFEADVELLRTIAALPSFDPFLMRERLRAAGVTPARCYFDLGEADVGRMRSFVSKEISRLIDLAFVTAGRDMGDLSARLAEKLMTDETAKSLEPLRQTLRLTGEEYVEGVFAWKGFLYYKWQMNEFRPQLAEFKPRFAGCRVTDCSAEERRDLAETRRRILDLMKLATDRVEQSLLEYAAAFSALADGQPGAFRTFLLKAPSMFIPIGEAVGAVKHIDSFWRFRFSDGAQPSLSSEEAMEVFHEFEVTLSGLAFVGRAARAAA